MQRAIAILGELADARGELGTNEIARRTGINVSTISRILATLVSGGLVEHVTATGRYRLGVGVIRLANAAGERLDVRSLARPHLEDLAGQVRETATLSVPGGHEAVTLDYVQSPLSVRSVAEVGRASAAHATAVGKVFLAHGGTIPAGPLFAYTERTIVDHDVLRIEVAGVQRARLGPGSGRARGGSQRGRRAGHGPGRPAGGDPRHPGPVGALQPPGHAQRGGTADGARRAASPRPSESSSGAKPRRLRSGPSAATSRIWSRKPVRIGRDHDQKS